MLEEGRLGGTQILSPESVARMTTDHLTPEQKAVSPFAGLFDRHGWGFGVAVATERDELGRSPGAFGWDGGLGTSWWSDRKEGIVGVLLTQRAWTSPSPPEVCRAFWHAIYS